MLMHTAFEFKGEAGEIKRMAAPHKVALLGYLGAILEQRLNAARLKTYMSIPPRTFLHNSCVCKDIEALPYPS